MLEQTPVPHEAVYLLADHLDAALAAGEDLMATRLPVLADLDETEDAAERELSRFVVRLGRLEASMIGRLLQARKRLAELPRQDGDFRPIARLFSSTTALIEELVGQMGDPSQSRFEAGHDRLPFLRDRGLLARDAAGLPLYETLCVTESFRVGALIELGPLLDMVSALLDALDDRYDLYGDRARGLAGPTEAAQSAENAEAATSESEGQPAAPTDKADLGAEPAQAAAPEEEPAPLTSRSLIAALQQMERAGRG